MHLYLVMLALLFIWELIYILVTAIGHSTLRTKHRIVCDRLPLPFLLFVGSRCGLVLWLLLGYKRSLDTLTWDIALCIILAVVSVRTLSSTILPGRLDSLYLSH